PGVCVTRPATPSFFGAPTPVGQFTLVATPTLVFHSGDTFARKSAQIYVVPDPSDRWTTVMSAAGRLTPAFSFAIAASFHLVILPMKMSASTGPVNFNRALTPEMLYTGTSAPSTVGKCRIFPGAASSWSLVIGPSVAPKNTVWL